MLLKNSDRLVAKIFTAILNPCNKSSTQATAFLSFSSNGSVWHLAACARPMFCFVFCKECWNLAACARLTLICATNQHVDPEVFYWTLTDGLCCTSPCSSSSHHILSSSWHTVIAWGRIWGWHEGVTTSSIYALSNVHILSIHRIPILENDLVQCDISSYTWAWANWVLDPSEATPCKTFHRASHMLHACPFLSN